MKTLSRREEQILLAICELKEDACLISIKKYLSRVINQNCTVGAIHKPLAKLEKAGFIGAYMGEATAKRGGRSKKIYIIKKPGLLLLTEFKRINDVLWANFHGIEFGK